MEALKRDLTAWSGDYVFTEAVGNGAAWPTTYCTEAGRINGVYIWGGYVTSGCESDSDVPIAYILIVKTIMYEVGSQGNDFVPSSIN